jgi:ElaB/YqjD/DUF883 family membrane-anchored ribosome-binding protein
MQTTCANTSVFGLVRNLTGDTKKFIRQELELAKAELSEKISSMGKNAAALAIGGFVAYAGLIVLLIGLGLLIAYAMERAGMERFLAGFLGLLIIGLVVAAAGYLFIAKALKAFKTASLKPERTMHTLHELTHSETSVTVGDKNGEEAKVSPDLLQAQVELTEKRMSETLDELGHRLSPKEINHRVKQKISAKPYSAGMIAIGAGLVSGLLLTRRSGKA